MFKTPKSLRLQIGLFGRTNVGKSTFLNHLTDQRVAITSPIPGTTTDVVEKPMELLPLGPVVFLDTGGIDDVSALSAQRVEKTSLIFDRADIYVLLVEPDIWGEFEAKIAAEARRRKAPLVIVINKVDQCPPSAKFRDELSAHSAHVLVSASTDPAAKEATLSRLKRYLIEICPEDFVHPPPLIGDLLPAGGLGVLVVPIDLQAPKGRLILPQVQTIRDALDHDAAMMVVKEREYAHVYRQLRVMPDIVACDSQVVLKMVADTPAQVKCTTFSILFARYKGDLVEEAAAAAMIARIKPGDRVLIAESCSHHPIQDDIGRVKIPRWFRQYAGGEVRFDVCAGRDFPARLSDYSLIVHCGGCMITRREKLMRIQKAKEAGVPLTNYGLCIAFLQGVLSRVLSPFPAALDRFQRRQKALRMQKGEK
ncbi:MAG: [FeFe] hydrogenase H-cluster maturation GTPase HydF [Candidatus Omnitrophica bacterium]|nr:[FeFe] hydrogenase H-cluster maturation GTPase HydF [Candidatus Omnitrophota bacterium]